MRVRGVVFYCLAGMVGLGDVETANAQAMGQAGDELVETSAGAEIVADGQAVSANSVPVPLPPGTEFRQETVVIGDAAGGAAAAAAGRLIYSNSKGSKAVSTGANILVADDIVTTAPNGCKLTQFSFDLSGRVKPTGADGPFSVSFALYDTCPGAVPPEVRPLRLITGTAGTAEFADGAPRTVHVLLGEPVAVPTKFWLALTFSRANAGPIVGAPALVGYSMDLYHQTGATPCATNFGDFPNQLHGSFNAQIHAGTDGEPCAPIHVDYHVSRENGPTYNPGANVWLIDDLVLRTSQCRLVGYEVTIRGAGTYNFELRDSCEGPAIAGTAKQQLVNTGANGVATRNLRFTVDPPVALPAEAFFAARANNVHAGVVVPGIRAFIGTTADVFYLQSPEGSCAERDVVSGLHDSLSVTLLCEGEAELGACCDMFVLECAGGTRDGLPCRVNGDCAGGLCESVCRDVPEINCPFPPRGTTQQPKWAAGGECSAEPFEHPCGQAACCAPFDSCVNVTQNECAAIEPVTAARQWQRGWFCGVGSQWCPWSACLEREGTCSIPHDWPGCADPSCCSVICNMDPLCCLVEWDEICVQAAAELTATDCRSAAANDSCWSTREDGGAHLVGASSRTLFINGTANHAESDPVICCHLGDYNICSSGSRAGYSCMTNGECPQSTCAAANGKAQATVWFRFVATHPVVEISTANEDGSGDTIFQLFAAGNPTSEQTACESLIPIGCADDCPDCGEFSAHGRLCVTGLTTGATYYLMVGSKGMENAGLNRLEIVSGNSCRNELPWAAGDCDGNGAADGCDLATGLHQDCDRTSAADFCELRDEITFDCDKDGLPDNCEPKVQGLPGGTTLWFGYAVTIDGDSAAVGEPGVHQDFQKPGKVHLFQRDGLTWQTAGLMTSPHTGPGDRFGEGLASNSQWLWVTAAGEQPGGAVYVYRREETGVVLVTRIEPDAALGIARMGPFIAAHASRAIINAEDTTGALRILVYAFAADQWSLEAVLSPSAPRSYTDWMHSPLDLFDNWIVVNTNPLSLFRRAGSAWVEETPIAYIPKGEESLGASVALQGDWLLVAECRDYGARLLRPYRRNGRDWSPEPPIQVNGYCETGPAIGLYADTVAMVAPDDDRIGLIFQMRGGAWSQVADLPWSGAGGPWTALSVNSTGVLVGRSDSFDIGFPSPGSAYVATLPPSDCDGNSRPDACDFRDGLAVDCNANQVPDACDDLAAFDHDFDGDVDLGDLARMQGCFTGPQGELGAYDCCGIFDGAGSPSIDAADWKAMVSAMSGP